MLSHGSTGAHGFCNRVEACYKLDLHNEKLSVKYQVDMKNTDLHSVKFKLRDSIRNIGHVETRQNL